MESLKELYKIGPGPSSSHTFGPQKAATLLKNKYPDVNKYIVTLYGSLSLTGKNHLSDYIILKTLKDYDVQIIWHDEALPFHPNGMNFKGYTNDNLIFDETYYSVGGGTIIKEGESESINEIYPENKFDDIIKVLPQYNNDLYEYVLAHEDNDFIEYITNIVQAMLNNTKRGLNEKGIIPGSLKLERIANALNEMARNSESPIEAEKLFISSYAYANSEENACGHNVVIAPTCGASGVIPALMYYYANHRNYPIEKLAASLCVGGIIGNLIKKNASISGAMGGCQAEIGSACAMGAAAIAYLEDLDFRQIEYASEIAIEHHLGLTCDPVLGYVQIPCIERNGQAALRAIDALLYAKSISQIRSSSVSLDSIIEIMKATGEDLLPIYRETSLGGLAQYYNKDNRLKKTGDL